MRYLVAMSLLAALIYGGWPYYEYHRFVKAVAANDRSTLEGVVDVASVRAERERALKKQVERHVPGQNPMAALVREGAQMVTRATGEAVNVEWVRQCLRDGAAQGNAPYPSVWERTSHAFFESPTDFVARVGELDGSPVHVRMRFRNWGWQVTALYGCE